MHKEIIWTKLIDVNFVGLVNLINLRQLTVSLILSADYQSALSLFIVNTAFWEWEHLKNLLTQMFGN